MNNQNLQLPPLQRGMGSPNDSQSDTNITIRTECARCKAGTHWQLSGGLYTHVLKNYITLKKGDHLPKSGDPIEDKNCPDCRHQTLIRH